MTQINMTRTDKVLKTIRVSLGFFIVLLVLRFVSRDVFLRHLGADFLGLYAVLVNGFGLLNLAELGIGSAIVANLYEPMAKKEHQRVSEIVSLQGFFYKRVAIFTVGVSFILLPFFVYFFAETALPLTYSYAIFFVMLIPTLLAYFIGYKQVLFAVDLQEYRLAIWLQGIQAIKILVQILTVKYGNHPIFWWLFLELGGALLGQLLIDWLVRRHYPWLVIDTKKSKQLTDKYQYILTQIKQLFFHKMAGQALASTPNLVIYSYFSLFMVTAYNNYMMIVVGLLTLISALFSGIPAGVGNLIATSDTQNVHKFFVEYLVVKVWLGLVVCVVMYVQANNFVTLWVGEQFVLGDTMLLWLLVYLFLSIARAFDEFLAGYQLFSDIYAPITEALLNVGLAFLLGHFFGLAGIIAGVVLSLLVVIFGWKPFFLYRYGFGLPFKWYLFNVLRIVVAMVVSVLLLWLIKEHFTWWATGFFAWFYQSLMVFLLVALISGLTFFLSLREYRQALYRMIGIVHRILTR